MSRGEAGRRWLAPEVVQSSAMDCGPAALKCLLEGFGIPVSYDRLREACQTGLDGTSIGHRTRMAQEPRDLWHREENRDLATYHRQSARFDRDKTWLLGLVGRGWLVLGIAALVPAFAAVADRVALAVGLGGVLTAYRGFVKLSEGSTT